jgi:hypothetical protein
LVARGHPAILREIWHSAGRIPGVSSSSGRAEGRPRAPLAHMGREAIYMRCCRGIKRLAAAVCGTVVGVGIVSGVHVLARCVEGRRPEWPSGVLGLSATLFVCAAVAVWLPDVLLALVRPDGLKDRSR